MGHLVDSDVCWNEGIELATTPKINLGVHNMYALMQVRNAVIAAGKKASAGPATLSYDMHRALHRLILLSIY
jgi:hypothetical protein